VAKVDLAGAMSVLCDRIGNEVSVFSATHPHHTNNTRVIGDRIGNERPHGKAVASSVTHPHHTTYSERNMSPVNKGRFKQ
jgi:hypothetical protein